MSLPTVRPWRRQLRYMPAAVLMRRYELTSKREAVNLALRTLAGETLDLEAARAMRGSGTLLPTPAARSSISTLVRDIHEADTTLHAGRPA